MANPQGESRRDAWLATHNSRLAEAEGRSG